ncbi:LacI family DNA-binding transcriptional regulator [Nonomuraea sp. NPDC049709]|uniref:LacI family DNA-binding transcriptional regulator n=1 Tax=Nonomuraea sp. NPDC049709 TaxID=3154736 RepID=UPI0034485D01
MPPPDPARRLTQRDIARLAGVSQTTVSLVLNNRADADSRIPAETRDRVMRVIRETGYVADPAARRLAAGRNRILGVFTYEPVFPSATGDFFHPFLVGIEECAEHCGCDLLLFTSAPTVAGRKRVYHQDHRLRLADGCVLLGRELDREDLTRLVAERYPFVSVGRRDDAGGTVPYVGADYPAAVRELVARTRAMGHERLAYLGHGSSPESYADRFRGFAESVPEPLRLSPGEPADMVERVLAAGVTAVLAEEYADGVALTDLLGKRGVSVPGDLSVLTLGDPTRPAPTDIDFTGFRIPRREMGRQAVEELTELIEGGEPVQRLLPCEYAEGATLAPART